MTTEERTRGKIHRVGWLERQFRQVNIEVATWPASMRREAGFDDSRLTDDERREAIKDMQARILELEGGEK